MVLFHRLRLRWRERRVDRKLREMGIAPAHDSVPRSGLKELLSSRVAVRPLRVVKQTGEEEKQGARGGAEHEVQAPTTSSKRSRNGSRSRTRVLSIDTPLDTIEIKFVKWYNRQRRHEFGDDVATLKALQVLVPAATHHIDGWIEKHHYCLHIRVLTERDLARWKKAQTLMHEELLRIRDVVASAGRLQLVDRMHAANNINSLTTQSQAFTSADTHVVSTIVPHAEICLAMVMAALIAGVYGLLALGIVLKFVHRI